MAKQLVIIVPKKMFMYTNFRMIHCMENVMSFLSLICTTHASPYSFGSRGKNTKNYLVVQKYNIQDVR